MFIQQKLAQSMTRTRDSFIATAARLSCAQTITPKKNSNPSNPFTKMSISCSGVLLFVLTTLPPVFAANNYATPKWYRYYNSQGIPTLSNTISEQHLQYGYDTLDKNMRLIQHFSAFSGQNYAQQQALRDQAAAKRVAERHLQETYISSDRAIIQRDRELGDLDGQIKRGQAQSATLSAALNASVTLAANLERQNKPITEQLKKQLKTNKDLLNQSQNSVNALKLTRDQSSKKYNDVIATLKNMEQRGKRSNSNVAASISK